MEPSITLLNLTSEAHIAGEIMKKNGEHREESLKLKHVIDKIVCLNQCNIYVQDNTFNYTYLLLQLLLMQYCHQLFKLAFKSQELLIFFSHFLQKEKLFH